MIRIFLFCVSLFFVQGFFAQNIEKTWLLTSINHQEQQNTFQITENKDSIVFNKGKFSHYFSAKDSLSASGDYILQNNLLVLFYNTPQDEILRYHITQHTDSTLVFESKELSYHFIEKQDVGQQATVAQKKLIPSEGFTLNSLWRGVLGMIALIFIAYLFSSNKKSIRWKTIGIGLFAQLVLAIGVLKVPLVQNIFGFVGDRFVDVLNYTRAGSEFLLGGMMNVESFGFIFLFQVLPTIIFFSALTSVLFYLGIIQIVVKGMAWVLTKLLKVSGAEGLAVAGNIFLGQTESPLMIKAYLDKMTKSEILLVMVAGMATVAGGVLAAYIGFLGGDDPITQAYYARHLLTASVMAAPGAIVIAKILYPQSEKIDNKIEVTQDKVGANILDAIANGTTEGLKLAANVGAMLLVFIAFIAMFNGIFGWIGEITHLNQLIAQKTPYETFSLEFVLGYILAPLMWVIGVAKEDMALMGQLLGIKLVASEFVGYIQLADLKNTANTLSLTYEKSVIIATYMLCGFANFASIGIQIGGIGSIAPTQRKVLSEFGFKALIGGTIASLLSATIAGMIIG